MDQATGNKFHLATPLQLYPTLKGRGGGVFFSTQGCWLELEIGRQVELITG